MEKQNRVIGPHGPLAGVIQLIVLGSLGFLMFVTILPKDLIVFKIIPASLIFLIILGHLSLLGDGYPLSPPMGNWTPGKSRLMAGVGMIGIWGALATGMLAFMVYVFPKWPISPLYLWFGVIAFTLTLLYGINWNGYPFKGRFHPWIVMAIAFILILTISTLVWMFLTNLDGTPFADTPMNHHGPLNVQWLTGYLVWVIACFFVFSPVFTTQGWPFVKLGHPGAALAQTLVALVLAYLCWRVTLAIGLSPTFSFGAVASSIITWSILYSWHLGFCGITKFTSGTRAVLAIIIEAVIVTVWIVLMNFALSPAAKILVDANLPADINILMIYFNLCVFAPAALAHNAFALRWPLTLPAPPGTPPLDQPA